MFRYLADGGIVVEGVIAGHIGVVAGHIGVVAGHIGVVAGQILHCVHSLACTLWLFYWLYCGCCWSNTLCTVHIVCTSCVHPQSHTWAPPHTGTWGPERAQSYLRQLIGIARRELGHNVVLYTTDPPNQIERGTLRGGEVFSYVLMIWGVWGCLEWCCWVYLGCFGLFGMVLFGVFGVFWVVWNGVVGYGEHHCVQWYGEHHRTQ